MSQTSNFEPIAIPLSQAPKLLGLSRSGIYRGHAAGQIVLLKAGRTTLVDVASGKAYIASLPRLMPKSAA